ncbi:MAG: tRNA (5-methylaminomethyl-2-thiouridine)(34)-methyltransferase MnmD [Cyclobacteriaceae bacterium]|nr:tRNA (5-methylaminomethyl-2-thiouridine)(34)-methyltransferase MnmD [Cyclobacteriaceae bacterium]
MMLRQVIITADGSHTLSVPELNETYHSTYGAVQESRHIFIHYGLDYWFKTNGSNKVKIFEVGFGTGLNALLSVDYAENHQKSILYDAIESDPIPVTEALSLNYPQMLPAEAAHQWFEQIHKSAWNEYADIQSNFRLKKIHGTIQDFQSRELYDVCYFDAFAPSKQPEMWEISILEKIEQLLNPGGVFTTYCAAGHLRRSLNVIGIYPLTLLPGPLRAKKKSYVLRKDNMRARHNTRIHTDIIGMNI